MPEGIYVLHVIRNIHAGVSRKQGKCSSEGICKSTERSVKLSPVDDACTSVLEFFLCRIKKTPQGPLLHHFQVTGGYIRPLAKAIFF